MALFHKLWHDQDGQGMVEYGLILSLIAIAIIVVFTTMGDKIVTLFGKANAKIQESAAAPANE